MNIEVMVKAEVIGKNKIDEFFIITNIETLRNDDIITALNKNPNEIGMILVDEVHKCKSTSSQQGSNLLKLKKFNVQKTTANWS